MGLGYFLQERTSYDSQGLLQSAGELHVCEFT